MSNSPLRLVMFDCDGTLVDSQISIVAAMNAMCAHHGFDPLSAEMVRRVVGLPLETAIHHLLGVDLTVSKGMSDTYKDAFFALRQQGNVQEPLYPGVLDVLDALDDAGWLMGVATGKSHRGLMNTLHEHDLWERFICHQTADRARGKPHPEMMLNALSQTGVANVNAVMVGDTTYDMEMAQNAGVRAVGVAWGYHEAHELEAAGAACIAYTAQDLSQALMTMTETP